ncbi:MAG: mannose-6-phosphate isomerase [Deltaproteobacteria bacterium]|nr:mannose-6-phosphate isomerase [Deltaproteobacteria bacterium]
MKSDLYPIVLEPIILGKPWGAPGKGPALVTGADPALKVGEVWVTADGEYQSTVGNGPLTGATLEELRLKWGADLLGQRFAGKEKEPFPLLLKFLHAAEYLSVQVHPDDKTAVRLEGSGPGKTEAWYILETDPGAKLILGLEPGIDRALLSKALEQGRVEEVLHSLEINQAESYYVHAGLLHAIGPGITLFEIQQNIDLTYRFYDWGRLDAEGNPRGLHLDKALEALDDSGSLIEPFHGLSFEEAGLNKTILTAGRYFALERWEFPSEWTGSTDPARFELMTVVKGRGALQRGETGEVELMRGLTVLLPAGLGEFRIQGTDGLTVLRSYVPDLATDIVEPLLSRGFASSDIIKLAGGKRPNDLSRYF